MQFKQHILFIYFLFLSFFINSNEYEVKTTSGITIGSVINGVINWDDIPYAQPPIGDLRWKAPRKINPIQMIKF